MMKNKKKKSSVKTSRQRTGSEEFVDEPVQPAARRFNSDSLPPRKVELEHASEWRQKRRQEICSEAKVGARLLMEELQQLSESRRIVAGELVAATASDQVRQEANQHQAAQHLSSLERQHWIKIQESAKRDLDDATKSMERECQHLIGDFMETNKLFTGRISKTWEDRNRFLSEIQTKRESTCSSLQAKLMEESNTLKREHQKERSAIESIRNTVISQCEPKLLEQKKRKQLLEVLVKDNGRIVEKMGLEISQLQQESRRLQVSLDSISKEKQGQPQPEMETLLPPREDLDWKTEQKQLSRDHYEEMKFLKKQLSQIQKTEKLWKKCRQGLGEKFAQMTAETEADPLTPLHHLIADVEIEACKKVGLYK